MKTLILAVFLAVIQTIPPVKDWRDNLSLIFTGLLVFAGLVTCGIIAWQSWETRRAASATQKAAEAAFLNAQAVINVERPWILVRGEAFEVKGVSAVVAKNCGRTPAKIVRFSLDKPIIIPSGSALPLPPDYGEISAFEAPIILLQDGQTYIATLAEEEVHRICKTKESWERIQSRQDELYVFGVIYYEDLLNSPSQASHETRWCCKYLPGLPNSSNRLVLTGGSGYNGYT
ncbi:MAG: hypothetical protein ABSD64_09035 [Terriglobales bacterium]|jgi:hypothetical protein